MQINLDRFIFMDYKIKDNIVKKSGTECGKEKKGGIS